MVSCFKGWEISASTVRWGECRGGGGGVGGGRSPHLLGSG